MLDKLEIKIKEIHKQPEHVRVQYMWGAMAIAMTIIIMIWLMSVKISFNKVQMNQKSQPSVENIQTQIQKIDNEITEKKESVSIDELLINNSTTPQ